MNRIMKIIFYDRTDSYDIAQKIIDDIPIEIALENTYTDLPETTISVNDMDSDTLDALKKLMDTCTETFEEGAYEFIIKLDSKGFDLADSYIRDTVDIIKPLTQIPDGTPLMARFEIPGFGENTFRDVTVYYNEDFDPVELLALAEIGITLTGDGSSFMIANTVDCRAMFFKPETAGESYIIDFDGDGQILAP